MAQEGGAAYKELTHLDDGLSQSLQYWGGIKARENAADRLREEREQVRAEKAEKDAFDSLQLAEGDFETTVTGLDNYDDINRDYTSHNVDLFGEWGMKGLEAFKSGDKRGYAEARAMQAKLKSNFKNIQNHNAVLKELMTDFMENADNISPVDEEYEKEMQAFTKNNYKFTNDEKGIPYIEFLIEGDDGIKRYTKKRWSDVVNGQYRPYMVYDLDSEKGWVNTMSSNLGIVTEKKPDGTFWKRTTKDITPEAEIALDSSIDGIVSGDRSMSSVLYQATGKKKKTGFTEDDYTTVRKYLKNRVLGNISTEDSREFAANEAAHYRGMERIKMDKEAADKKAEEEGKPVYNAEIVTTKGGDISREAGMEGGLPEGTQREDFLGTEEYTIKDKEGNAMKGVISNDVDAEVISIVRSKKNEEGGRNYYARIRTKKATTEVGKEGGSTMIDRDGNKTTTRGSVTETKKVKLTDIEMSRIAELLGLTNSASLDNYLTGRKNLRFEEGPKKKESGSSGGAAQWNKKQ
jgi:hypothetical protein